MTATNHPKAFQEAVMNLRLFICPILGLLLAPWAFAQQSLTEIPSRSREEILQQIAVCEASIKEARSTHANDEVMAKTYSQLASLDVNAARYGESEAAFEHAISLLRRNPGSSGELAKELAGLGWVHLEMGKMRQAESEELEALKLREGVGDSLETARSWNSLAAVYLRWRKYRTARDFARRAVDEFSVNQHAGVVDRVSSQFGLAMALCSMKDCASAISLLKEAIGTANATFQAKDFPLGVGYFLLGFAYWQSGSLSEAGRFMEQGTAIMKEQLGWGHPAYLNALRQYALFLRKSQRSEEAKTVEHEIRQAEAVVDVHSIQTRGSGDVLAGLR
jgi:tetratricopeptide (TPR) repeat protein